MYTHAIPDRCTIPGGTRKAVIHAVLQTTEDRSLRIRSLSHQVLGHVLWAVMEVTDKRDGSTTCYLSCSLLYRRQQGWSYQTFTEESFSNIYTCPIEYLDRVPGEVNPTWRQYVREFQSLMSSPASCWAA